MLRGVERLIAQPSKKRRWGVRTQDLSLAIQMHLDASSSEGAMWGAALSTASCGLLRGCEFGLQDGEASDPSRHLGHALTSSSRRSQTARYT